MHRAHELTESERLHIVQSIQQLLYLDEDDERVLFWNPDKQWSGAEVCQSITTLLDEHGLVPDRPQTF